MFSAGKFGKLSHLVLAGASRCVLLESDVNPQRS
jgi:hypothetical protein